MDDEKRLSMLQNEHFGEQKLMELVESSNMSHICFRDMENMKEIGSGGSGTIVFQALWKRQRVAIKLFKINQHTLSDNEIKVVIKQFTKEVGALNHLNHPNIISFYGVIIEFSRVGIVMEYCSNGNLQSMIAKKFSPMSLASRSYSVNSARQSLCSTSSMNLLAINSKLIRKIEIMLQISKGMQYLHGKNMIHRDLKPENILIDENMVAKIIDFGLTKTLRAAKKQLTRNIGTPQYMAPEVLSGDYDGKCDVYSFAMIMYQVLFEKKDIYFSDAMVFNATMSEACRPEIPALIAEYVAVMSSFEESIPSGDFDAETAAFVETQKITAIKIFESLVALMKVCWKHNPVERPTFEFIAGEFTEMLEDLMAS